MNNLIGDYWWCDCEKCGSLDKVYCQQTTEEGEVELGWSERYDCQVCGDSTVYEVKDDE